MFIKINIKNIEKMMNEINEVVERNNVENNDEEMIKVIEKYYNKYDIRMFFYKNNLVSINEMNIKNNIEMCFLRNLIDEQLKIDKRRGKESKVYTKGNLRYYIENEEMRQDFKGFIFFRQINDNVFVYCLKTKDDKIEEITSIRKISFRSML